MKLNKIEIEIKRLVYKIIEKTNIKPDMYTKSINEMDKKIKLFKPGVSISFKEIFGDKKYSTEEYYEEYLNFLKSGNVEVAYKEQIDFLELFTSEFAKDPYTFDLNMRNLIKSLYWASESLYDFSDTFILFMDEYNNENNNLVQLKMLFKEFYSLIDRLRTEAAIEISTNNMNLSRDMNDVKSREYTNKWRNRMPQDLILNGDTTKISKSIAYITEFEMDEDGWVKFKYEDMDTIISPWRNSLFKIIRDTRNFNEHSASNRFIQNYIESGQILSTDSSDIIYKKLCEIWKSKIFLVFMIYFYHLFKISEVHEDVLF